MNFKIIPGKQAKKIFRAKCVEVTIQSSAVLQGLIRSAVNCGGE